jgi:lysozyme
MKNVLPLFIVGAGALLLFSRRASAGVDYAPGETYGYDVYGFPLNVPVQSFIPPQSPPSYEIIDAEIFAPRGYEMEDEKIAAPVVPGYDLEPEAYADAYDYLGEQETQPDTDVPMSEDTAKGFVEPAAFITTPEQGARNLNAFLKMLRVIESSDNYGAIVGGGTITDFSEHPWILEPRRPYPPGYNSNASGAYQFLSTTWKIARDKAGVKDFSPRSQDLAAIEILKFPWRRGAYADVVGGRFDMAVQKLPLEWESLKLIMEGRYPYSYAQIKQIYAQAGGSDAPGSAIV